MPHLFVGLLAGTKIFFIRAHRADPRPQFSVVEVQHLPSAPHKSLLLCIVGTRAFTAGLIQVPGVLEAFGIAAPAASDLGIIVALGVFITITIEITKAVLRAKAPVARERSHHNSAAGQHSYIALGKNLSRSARTRVLSEKHVRSIVTGRWDAICCGAQCLAAAFSSLINS